MGYCWQAFYWVVPRNEQGCSLSRSSRTRLLAFAARGSHGAHRQGTSSGARVGLRRGRRDRGAGHGAPQLIDRDHGRARPHWRRVRCLGGLTKRRGRPRRCRARIGVRAGIAHTVDARRHVEAVICAHDGGSSAARSPRPRSPPRPFSRSLPGRGCRMQLRRAALSPRRHLKTGARRFAVARSVWVHRHCDADLTPVLCVRLAISSATGVAGREARAIDYIAGTVNSTARLGRCRPPTCRHA